MTQSQFDARLSELLPSSNLDDQQSLQLWRYFDLLRRWNARINLTALPLSDDSNDALRRLLAEPIAAALAYGRLVERSARVSGDWFDLGSGSGSPGLPMRVVLPELSLTLVESVNKKAAFLREAVRVMELERVSVLSDRLESLVGQPSGSAALVTCRGLRLDPGALDVCRHVLASGGYLLALSGIQSGAVGGFEDATIQERATSGTSPALRILLRL